MLSLLLSMLESDADRVRFTAIYEEHHARAEQAALRILKDSGDAEDAVQNAFVQVIRHFEKTFEIPCNNLGFWIVSIVKNEAIMILRKKRRELPLKNWDTFSTESTDTTDYAELVKLFSKLPETYRAVLEMRLLLDYSGREIAQQCQHADLGRTGAAS